MNQTELAQRTGYSRHMISLLLTGKRDASKIGAKRLAKAVKGSSVFDWIFCKDNYKKLSKLVRVAK